VREKKEKSFDAISAVVGNYKGKHEVARFQQPTVILSFQQYELIMHFNILAKHGLFFFK